MNTQTEWRFRLLNREERAQIYETYMREDFPEDELKPLGMMERAIDRGLYQFWGCFHGEQLAGYYTLAYGPDCPMVLLDYLAILPQLRGAGCGTVVLGHLRETLPEGTWLCIESERPEGLPAGAERTTRERRIHFYLQGGAVRTPVQAHLFGVNFALLALTRRAQPDAQAVTSCYHRLYCAMLAGSAYEAGMDKVVRTAPDAAAEEPKP